jgi:hypothetical protein
MKAKAQPVAIGKAYTFAEVLAEMQAKADAENKRRAAMTPEQLAEQLKKDEENEKKVQKILAQLGPGGPVRIKL